MSDFDKEAEREKLREKYEREDQQREATERMSDLLLKGATMTNAHCGTCGDPIFRYEGQEFCPTCQELVGDDQPEQAADQPAETGTADPEDAPVDAQSAATEPAQAEQPQEGGTPEERPVEDSPTPDDGHAPVETEGLGVAPPDESTDDTQQSAAPTPTEPAGRDARDPGDQPRRESTGTHSAAGGDTDSLAPAREGLTRSIARLVTKAERADDLERTRAYLAAVEEAADALDAVKRADR